MEIPKEITEFLNKPEIQRMANNFQGKYYWYLFSGEIKTIKDGIVLTTTMEMTAVVENYHPFLAIEALNKVNNITYYLKNYKEISREEFDFFKILNPLEREEK